MPQRLCQTYLFLLTYLLSTTRVDGLTTRLVETARPWKPVTRQLGPSTLVVETGLYLRHRSPVAGTQEYEPLLFVHIHYKIR